MKRSLIIVDMFGSSASEMLVRSTYEMVYMISATGMMRSQRRSCISEECRVASRQVSGMEMVEDLVEVAAYELKVCMSSLLERFCQSNSRTPILHYAHCARNRRRSAAIACRGPKGVAHKTSYARWEQRHTNSAEASGSVLCRMGCKSLSFRRRAPHPRAHLCRKLSPSLIQTSCSTLLRQTPPKQINAIRPELY